MLYNHNAWVRSEHGEIYVMMGCDFLDFKKLLLDFGRRILEPIDPKDSENATGRQAARFDENSGDVFSRYTSEAEFLSNQEDFDCFRKT